MFVLLGITLFIITIYFIGKNKNLFASTFHIKSQFKNVSGLKIGNNVRFSGINIGTVKNIEFVSDSAVMVDLIIKEEVQKYIKKDAIASIGSDGLMGDKVLTISPGTSSVEIIKDNGTIVSSKAIELEDLMKGLQKSVNNAGKITDELATFTSKMNNNNGALSKLMTDENFSNSRQILVLIRRPLSGLFKVTFLSSFPSFKTTSKLPESGIKNSSCSLCECPPR